MRQAAIKRSILRRAAPTRRMCKLQGALGAHWLALLSYASMRDSSPPNIYQVAKRAGVSTATVSRVLSRPVMVAARTRRKVMRAVELLGYVPNSAGKNLRSLRSRKLLVTVPD